MQQLIKKKKKRLKQTKINTSYELKASQRLETNGEANPHPCCMSPKSEMTRAWAIPPGLPGKKTGESQENLVKGGGVSGEMEGGQRPSLRPEARSHMGSAIAPCNTTCQLQRPGV